MPSQQLGDFQRVAVKDDFGKVQSPVRTTTPQPRF